MVKTITYAMNALLEDKKDINFVANGSEKFFGGFVFVSDDKTSCKIRPSVSMEDGKTSHITSPNSLARAETL